MSYFEDFEEYRIGSLEHEDYYINNINKPKYIFQTLNNKWKTKDGTIMKLSEMKTSHIINCLNMINKQCNKECWKPNTFPIYNNLRNELQKRI